MDPEDLTEDEAKSLISLNENLVILGRMFQNGEESLEGLRMAIASMRVAADTLEKIAIRWEKRGTA